MRLAEQPLGMWNRIAWRVLSVPIALKILGLGGLVTLIFACVTLSSVRGAASHALYRLLGERAKYMAYASAGQVEDLVVVGDDFEVDRVIDATMAGAADVRYILVQDEQDRVVGHTFRTAVPPDLLPAGGHDSPPRGQVRVLRSAAGPIYEAAAPILEGRAGVVRLGLDDSTVRRELRAITQSMLWALALCATIGLGLGVAFTYSVAYPVHHLVLASDRIRQGNLEVSAEVHSGDEIGWLATVFNRMVEALRTERRTLQEKEEARLALLARLVTSQEEERQRVARELHDQFGQALSTLLLATNPPGSANGCRDCAAHQRHMEELIAGLIDQVRNLAWHMHPAVLDDYGLDSALARYVQRMTAETGVDIEYQSSGLAPDSRLPADVEVALYRIAQEAITNILRHARAAHVGVVLLRRSGEALLLVEDDGVGFDPDVAARPGRHSLGLLGMSERAALLGGDLVIHSAPGEGTMVRVRVPLGG